jgi:hypothetical protein
MGWREKGPPPVRKTTIDLGYGSVWHKVFWHGNGGPVRSPHRHPALMSERRAWDEQYARRSRRWTTKTLAWIYKSGRKPRSWKNYRDHQWKPVVA